MEIGGSTPHLDDVFDAAEQVEIGRVGLVYHRRTFALAVVDQQVNLVVVERGFLLLDC